MDGTFAVLFLIAGLTDMGLSHCTNDGCLAPDQSAPRLALSAGSVMFQEENIGEEIYARYDLGQSYGPFELMAGGSVTDEGLAWVGMGAGWTGQLDRAYLQLHLMPGLYSRGGGPDLGSVVEFRSGVEVGYEARNGIRYGLSYDHRSNADITSVNPGLETLQFRVSVPLD